MIKLDTWDLLAIALYIILLLYLGFRTFRQTNRSRQDDFLLANRTLTLPSFVATLVTTWYGGILGIGEFAYNYGLSTWVVFGLPYYIFALLYAVIRPPGSGRPAPLPLPICFIRNTVKPQACSAVSASYS